MAVTKFRKNKLKNFFYLLFREFLKHFSNKPYPNVKIILVYFYMIKTI